MALFQRNERASGRRDVSFAMAGEGEFDPWKD
jgi:hypothetical protein